MITAVDPGAVPKTALRNSSEANLRCATDALVAAVPARRDPPDVVAAAAAGYVPQLLL